MSDPANIYQLKIELPYIKPAIWRRLLVPSTVTLRGLHGIIQKSMGWKASHRHWFQQDGRQFGRPDPDGDKYFEDDVRIRLGSMLCVPGDKLEYQYDFGDSWRHTIVLEEILAADGAGARCIGGARACPPEDCGGIHGYHDFLSAVLNPYHPKHRQRLEWAGGPFNPEAFDLEAANRRIGATRKV